MYNKQNKIDPIIFNIRVHCVQRRNSSPGNGGGTIDVSIGHSDYMYITSFGSADVYPTIRNLISHNLRLLFY